MRHKLNPLITSDDLRPSSPSMIIECVLNPGVFVYKGRIGMVLRIAERPEQTEWEIKIPKMDDCGHMEILAIPKNSEDLDLSDPRVISYCKNDYLTTISHLRILWSDDGVHFKEDENYPNIFSSDKYETFGVEDCRVTKIGEVYYLTYTAVSENGVAVKMKVTSDWKKFEDNGLILPPHNKDCALFQEKIGGKYYMLHRPSSLEIGGSYIWIAESNDLKHWGNHQCIAKTRRDFWDCAKVGAGCSPIRTDEGWLEIYHGVDYDNRYCFGALLLDIKDPSIVIARSLKPFMEPQEEYELNGFFGNVIFTNGQIVEGNIISIYYGASDTYVCRADFDIQDILDTLF